VIVEGQYDALQLRRLGWPAYSVLGSSLSAFQVGHLAYLATAGVVLVYPDNDKPGFVQQAAGLLKQTGLVTLAPEMPYEIWAEPKADPDDLCRDNPEYILFQLEHAKEVRVR
jgi:DNA primase